MGRDLMLAELPENQALTSKQIKIQLQRIKEVFGVTPILAVRNMSWTNRSRLIENRINFVVPGRQLYLPDLMIDLRERFSAPNIPKDALLPSAQSILLCWILRRNPDIEDYTQKQLAAELKYSPMTITNAVANLTHLNLCEIVGKKPKHLRFLQPRAELWRRSLTLMVTPVSKSVFVDTLPEKMALYKSNISALAHYTSINEGVQQYFAIGKQEFLTFKKDRDIVQLTDSEGRYRLELWKYDPGIPAEKTAVERVVDPLSLYLSLRENRDERIEKARDSLVGDRIW
jgi:DNA-binding MarR family transcriptional regulator